MKRRPPLLAWLVLGVAALASAQGLRESVRVGLVTVRLDVRGGDGRPLQDLKASEVKLRVDGRDVAIEGLDRIGAGAARSVESAGAVPPAPAVESPGAPAAAPTSNTDLYMAILLDETATNSFDRRDVHRQFESFLKARTTAGVHVMLERFDGHLRTECLWTTDAAKLLDAARRMSKRTFDPRMPSPSQLADEIRNGRKPKDVELQVDLAARRSFDGILQALLQFPDVPGRKALVVVTDGTPLMAPFDLSLMLAGANVGERDIQKLRTEGKGAVDPATAKMIEEALRDEAHSTLSVFGAASDATWFQRMGTITRKALELDIAFYPVNAEAIDRGTNPGVSSKWPGRSMPGVEGGAALAVSGMGMTARVGVAQSMGTLAEKTGGQTILVPNQLSDRLETVVSERTAGYVLTFRDPFANDWRFHSIEIAVERPNVKVSYRRGYRVRNDDERTLDAVVANLNDPSAENPLHAKLTFEPIRKDGGRSIVAMKIEFPRPPEAPGSETAERDIQVWAVCADDDGNRAKPMNRKAKARSATGDKSGPFVDTMQLGLPPGPYTWSVAVKDIASGLTSYLVVRKVL